MSFEQNCLTLFGFDENISYRGVTKSSHFNRSWCQKWSRM